jgi:predicted S18 family serine protease
MYRYARRKKYVPPSKNMRKTLLLVLASFLLLFLGFYFGSLNQKIVYYNQTKTSYTINYIPYIPFNITPNASFASIVIPAVDEEGNGITTTLFVQVMEGDGRILVNIDKLIFWTDTQNSIRISTKVASNITKHELSKYDIIYTMFANSSSVEGPSAGAAIAIATIAALEHKKINQKVFITGGLEEDGRITPVGEIMTKAKVVKEMGGELFLVPPNQSQTIIYETKKYCEKKGYMEICMSEIVPKKINISDEVGIKIIEVSHIKEAMQYFFSEG